MTNRNSQKPRRGPNSISIIAFLCCALLFVGLIVTRWTKSTSIAESPELIAPSAANVPLSLPATNRISGLAAPRSQASTTSDLSRAIRDTLGQLRAEGDVEAKRRILENLKRQILHSGEKTNATAAILEFLRTGDDSATGLRFHLGPNHGLTEAPALRSALLDWLGQIDPVTAATYSISIFDAMNSPEEYAIALRNFARGRPADRDALRDYFNRMLAYTPWAENPSAGYLESFDVVPHLADPSFIGPLSARLSPATQVSVRHASLLALDRLVEVNPAAALAEVSTSPALNDQPLVRASFLARADVRDEKQSRLVEQYLLSGTLSDRELDKFAHLFPNANRFVSFNLLTESSGRTMADQADLDAAALQRVLTWQSDARFSTVRDRLQILVNRLQEHIGSARRGGYLSDK